VKLPELHDIYAAHRIVIERFGGGEGVIASREPYLESALRAVSNRVHYEQCHDVIELAGLLTCRLCNAHAFVDGNKRVAALILQVFLEENGYQVIKSSQMGLAHLITNLAASKVTENEFAEQLASFVEPL